MKKNDKIYLVTISGETLKKDMQKVFTSYQEAYAFVHRETIWAEGSKTFTPVVVPGVESSEEGWYSCTTYIIHRGDNDAASIYASYVITTLAVDEEDLASAY